MPVFWEDDIHWSWSGTTWNVDDYYDRFVSPGLKIINVHPIHFALNTPNEEFYRNLPKPANDLTKSEIEKYRFSGLGTRTFVIELLSRMKASGQFDTLAAIYEESSELRFV